MGNYLAERRKALGITQKEIAELVDVSEATVSRWESGEIANMRRDRIAAYAKALKVTPNFIMTGNDESLESPLSKIKAALQQEDGKVAEIMELFVNLPADKQQEALNYLRYLSANANK